jgi:hypothetical protein
MKKLIWNLSFFLWCVPAFAQTNSDTEFKRNTEIKSLIGKDTRFGFYGALNTHYSRVAKQDALSFGGRVGITLNHSLGLGIGGNMVTNNFNNNWALPGDIFQVDATYGGLYIEPVLHSQSLVHMSFPILIGTGGANHFVSQHNSSSPDVRVQTLDSDNFFVLEPGVNLEVNLTSFMALGIGATYQYTTGFRMSGLSNHALDGLTGGVTVKIGKF